MKVDTLLGPYLYQFKRLSLPGIGTFTLDDKAVLPDETAKIKTAIEGITFSPKAGAQLDDSLIQFIRDQTGKMKPLAEADLYSYIATAFQYLNIGKPFHFEGIGSLQKNKDNGYTFAAGTVIPQKTEEIPHKHIETKRKAVSAYGNEEPASSSNVNAGRLVVVFAVLATLALVAWGGYYLYNKNTSPEESTTQAAPTTPVEAPVTTPVDSSGNKPDSLTGIKPPDSTTVAAATSTVAPPTGSTGYKFIFETTQKKTRADKRYTQLKGVSILKEYNNTVAVESKDSTLFKIYTVVPCPAADTNKVKQQLNAWYYGNTAMKVTIEQ